MGWTSPATWSPGQVIGASDLNAQLRDNEIYLFTRPQQCIKRDNGADYTTTSTSWVDIDGTNLKITLNISGSAVLLGFFGAGYTGGVSKLDFDIDGTRFASAGVDGLSTITGTSADPIGMVALVTGLSAGSHTFKIVWRVSSGTAGLRAGSGGANVDFIPTFWAIEVG